VGRHKKATKVRSVSPVAEEFEPPLDPGIAPYVVALRAAGVETFESCAGGGGHCFPEPTVRFHGDPWEGFRALSEALRQGMPVSNLRRFWSVDDGEPVGPDWEMTFSRPAR
jgi:hypothetical protein